MDLLAHAALELLLLARHGAAAAVRPAPDGCLGGLRLLSAELCVMAWINSRLWGLLAAKHPYPGPQHRSVHCEPRAAGLNLGLATDGSARQIANEIYEFDPPQQPAVWGTAYLGEALVVFGLMGQMLRKIKHRGSKVDLLLGTRIV